MTVTAGEGLERFDEVLDRLPCLAGRARTVAALPGGLTNHNLRVRTDDGQDLVVRISPPSTTLLAVDRHSEWLNSQRAAAAGVGAPVVDYLPGQGVLALAFLPGRTYAAADVGANLDLVADGLRRLHRAPEFASRFDMFDVQARYRGICRDRGLALPEGYDDLAPAVARLRAALSLHPEPLVPCHNDLLAANFLEHERRVWIIDYEYSGNNEASFELGNLWAESQLTPEQLEELVAHYHHGPGTHEEPDPVAVARAELWAQFSRHGWTLWGVIQGAISEIDEDFWGWSMAKHEPAMAFFTSGRFDALLDVVATTSAAPSARPSKEHRP